MKAIIIGATGKDLLSLLLQDDYFEQVIVFVRRELDFHHKKCNPT